MALWQDFVAIHDAVFACLTDEVDASERLDAALEEYRSKGCWLTAQSGRRSRPNAVVHRAQAPRRIFTMTDTAAKFQNGATFGWLVCWPRPPDPDSDLVNLHNGHGSTLRTSRSTRQPCCQLYQSLVE